MIMGMDGQLQRLLLQLVLKSLLVHGCRYVDWILADFITLDASFDQLSHEVSILWQALNIFETSLRRGKFDESRK
jgi:hypothetical protein